MKVILCIDDKGGMLFNHRRQSRDCKLMEDVAWFVGGGVLCCNEYSAKLFAETKIEPVVSEDFLETAEAWDFCFVEDKPLASYLGKIQQLVIYKWNRTYPADFYLDLKLNDFMRVETVEFPGNSHEKITREVYVR